MTEYTTPENEGRIVALLQGAFLFTILAAAVAATFMQGALSSSQELIAPLSLPVLAAFIGLVGALSLVSYTSASVFARRAALQRGKKAFALRLVAVMIVGGIHELCAFAGLLVVLLGGPVWFSYVVSAFTGMRVSKFDGSIK